VSFEQTLAALLALIGRRVDVAIASPASGLVAHFSGELAQGHELTHGAAGGPLLFSLGDGATFMISPDAFRAATRRDGLLRIEDVAGVAIIVDPAPAS
jgi:hypothetical protein